MAGRAMEAIVVPKGTFQIKLDVKSLSQGAYKIVCYDGAKVVSKILMVE